MCIVEAAQRSQIDLAGNGEHKVTGKTVTSQLLKKEEKCDHFRHGVTFWLMVARFLSVFL